VQHGRIKKFSQKCNSRIDFTAFSSSILLRAKPGMNIVIKDFPPLMSFLNKN